MKINKYFLLIFIICILFSITAVLAGDNQSGADLSSDNQNDFNFINWIEKLLGMDKKSFEDLYDDILEGNDTLELTNNYKYGESDNKTQFLFCETNDLLINGNNHVIDCSNNPVNFTFINAAGDITINDVTFVDCNLSVSTDVAGKLHLNNVNFTNNNSKNVSDSFEVLTAKKVTLNDCNFDSSIIGIMYSDVAINNSHFHSVDDIEAPVTVNRNDLFVENSTFEDISTKYGAVNFKGDCLSVKNSTFRNIHADLSGGAILGAYYSIQNWADENETVRPARDMLIDNCVFSNVSSSHNGGTIYMDFSCDDKYKPGPLHISNCNFTDSSSGFGGFIAAQSGILNISNTNFINSKANDLGGSIYSSWTDLTLTNCSLINSSAESDAGAIYFDYGKLTIDNSNLTGNKVNSNSSGNESIIYANDAAINVHDSTFNNGGVAIYENFAGKDSIIKNVNSTDRFMMNNTDYIVSVENKGIHLNLINNSSVVDKLPSKFDGREMGWTSPIKYQGDSYSCWAYATAAALESSLLKATGKLYNISENNINNLQLKFYSEGDLRNNHTGFAYSGLGYSLSWYGVVTSKDDSFDERGMFSRVVQTDERIHLQDAMIIFGGRNDTSQLLKSAVINNGAASVQYAINEFNYNNTTSPVDISEGNTHFVSVIGWDDDYSAENFKGSTGVTEGTIPKGNGAWLVKDSENEDLSENEATYMREGGYVWISYYNPSFLSRDMSAIIPQPAAVSYIFENTNDYHVNYQTDLTGLCGFDGNYTHYSNEFTSKYSEQIGAVGTYFNESGIDYSFDIFVNGKKVHSQNGVSEFAGFKTIVLDKYVPIKKGDDFKVVFKNNALPYQDYSRQHYMPNMSLISKEGKSWKDISLENKTVCLKVYTLEG